MLFASISYEPWESFYMAFAWPGLIGWIAGVVWWFRDRDRFLALGLQVVGAFEIVVGVVAAYAYAILECEEMVMLSGQWDPTTTLLTQAFVADVVLIGIGCHVLLLLATGSMTMVTYSRLRKRRRAGLSEGLD